MKAIINSIEFEETHLEIDSWRRDSVDRSIGGLDGLLSVDLGCRGRKLTQSGILRAASKQSLIQTVDAISNLMDGQTYTMISGDGRNFEELRIDSFEVEQTDYSGRGVCCDFEIKYTQLRNL